jgi:HupE / UreJ protein
MRWIWFVLWGALFAPGLHAHALPQSLLVLNIEQNHVLAEVRVPLDRLQMAHALPAGVGAPGVLPAYQAQLAAYALAHVRPQTLQGQAWSVAVERMAMAPAPAALLPAQVDVLFTLRMTPPPQASLRHWRLIDDMVSHEVVTHKILVALGHDWRQGRLSGEPQLIGTIQFGQPYIDIDVADQGHAAGWWAAVVLGAHHIAEGFDHLLFLVVLMIPAPLRVVGRRWGSKSTMRQAVTKVLLIVSSFTLGHSISLMIGGLTAIRFPVQPVEVLIAASILVSCMHAWRPVLAGREYAVAGVFGLIHGMAFASTLTELGLHGLPKVVALLGFNLGIELMQLLLVAAVLPCLFVLARWRFGAPARHALIGASSIMALTWLVQRF